MIQFSVINRTGSEKDTALHFAIGNVTYIQPPGTCLAYDGHACSRAVMHPCNIAAHNTVQN